jgi:predicted transglutaminase-like cysteine proteinase
MKRRMFTRHRRRRSFWRTAAVLMIGAALVLAFQPRDAAPAVYPALFGTKEVRSDDLRPFPKWTGVLDRYFKEKDLPDGKCDSKRFNRCHLAEWKRFLAEIAAEPRRRQVELVNRRMNSFPYITDLRNLGVEDYWATPRQFLYRDGDCEDYAIAKYMSLRALGFTPEELRVVVLQDLNLRIAHAVLVVFLDEAGLILDNQIRQVVDQAKIRHYRPYYSINETAWWLHKALK